MHPLSVVINDEYHLGIGDPTPFAWVVVVLYMAAAWASFMVGRRATKMLQPVRVVWFWRLLATMLLLLGINKQLDLQSLVTTIGKRTAQQEGWYARRRPVQVAFIGLVAAIGFGIFALSFYLTRGPAGRRCLPALAGVLFLVCFITIRAASFHHVDRLLIAANGIWGLNQTLEAGGNLLVITAAAWAGRASGSIPDRDRSILTSV